MRLQRFSVVSQLPDSLIPLRQLANNFWWSWNPQAIELFRSMDPELWEKVYHNPVRLLRELSQARLAQLSDDPQFLAKMKAILATFESYLAERRDNSAESFSLEAPIAYFSAEFGLHESLPVYSGGLGILAGDHCKSASDLNLPLVGVGLMYKSGYFVQSLNEEGMQEAIYPEHNFDELPISCVLKDDGTELKISLVIAGRVVFAKIWHVQVGRIPLYLLDTDIPDNDVEAQQITSKLYGGGSDTRLAQEMLLGIGGVRALRALGIEPSVFHINEGHAAFLALERIRLLMEEGLSFGEALTISSINQVFTTHTPVPAGHDRFGRELFERYLSGMIGEMDCEFSDVWNLGVHDPHNPEEPFCMTILAFRTARAYNGVSQLHGEVSREMWSYLWKDIPQDEIPIQHITNGVHAPTWLAPEMRNLFDRYLGPRWEEELQNPDFWRGIEQIPDEILWETKRQLKRKLIKFIRERTFQQRQRFDESIESLERARRILDENILTIGFARRFAPYKRATLIFQDPERLKRIINQAGKEVQFVFAGKSHPHNQEGKDILQKVYQFSRQEGFEGRIVFIEDYDTNVARYLVQGVDIWLNNPLRPQEASGTSGQKVPLNGGINFSILDGWWIEGYNGRNGWSIGDGKDYGERQNAMDAHSLYDTLEEIIIPLYYNKRNEYGFSPQWLQTMKASMTSIIPRFNTRRMVFDYLQKLYRPAAKNYHLAAEARFEQGKALHTWKRSIAQQWNEVAVIEFTKISESTLTAGSSFTIEATVQLGDLLPQDVAVELYLGRFDERGSYRTHRVIEMEYQKSLNERGQHLFATTLVPDNAGDYGYNVRIRPSHPLLLHPHETTLIAWGE